MRAAIDVPGHQKSVPMHRCVDIKRILDRHLHLVAAAQPDDRTKDGRRVAVGPRRLALDERVPSRRDLQFYRVSLVSRVDERGWASACRSAWADLARGDCR